MLKYIIIVLVSIGSCFASLPRHNALIVAEYGESKSNYIEDINLVKYHFTDGNLIYKDTILDAASNTLKYSFVDNILYKNRYIITANRYIIDIQTKAIIKEDDTKFVEAMGDSLIFYSNENGYYIYDLKIPLYYMVEDFLFLNVMVKNSPNHKWGLGLHSSPRCIEIILYDETNQPDTIVKDTCNTAYLTSVFNNRLTEGSIYWIDNDNFLYLSYEAQDQNTEINYDTLKNALKKSEESGFVSIDITPSSFEGITATATINKVNIKSRESGIVVKIDSVPLEEANISFHSDPDGKIIFGYSNQVFEVDIENKEVRSLKFKNSGFDFSIEDEMNPEYGRIIKYQNKEIGRVWCDKNIATTDGFISVPYNDLGSNLGEPKGVMVWNNITKQWIKLEIPFVSGIIGWVEE